MRGRRLNQAENRTFVNDGMSRCADTPEVFSMILRVRDPGSPPIIRFISGAARVATLPTRSVCASTFVVARRRTGTWPVAWRMASARSISRGKSIAHSCRPGVYGQFT